jgi:hypothetical protein
LTRDGADEPHDFVDVLGGAGERPDGLVGFRGHHGSALHDAGGVLKLRGDGLHGFAEVVRRCCHRLDVAGGLVGGRRHLARLLARRVRDRRQRARGLGELACHRIRVGQGRLDGRAECRHFGLDALSPTDLLRIHLVLGGNQRDALLGADLQIALHDSERFQKAAEFVAPAHDNLVGKIAGRDALGDFHRGKNRPAQGVGEGECKQKTNQCRADRQLDHGAAFDRHSCFRFAAKAEAVGRDNFHQVVKRDCGFVSFLNHGKGRRQLGEPAGWRLD